MRNRTRILLVLVALLAAGLGVVPTAAAESFLPGTTYSMGSNVAAQDIRIPLPDGLIPTAVSGRLIFDSDVGGRVEVLTDRHIVATVPKAPTQRELPLEFPVTAADVDRGELVFSVRYLTDGVTDPELFCLRSDYGTVQLVDTAIETTGAVRPPTTVADFFDLSVRAIAIRVPEDPAPEVRQAALAATSALAHRYTRATAITVTTPSQAPRAARAGGLDGRLVDILPGEGEVRTTIGNSGGVPVLTLTGDPALLTAAATAFGSELLDLAAAPGTTRLSANGTGPAVPVVTLADLGVPAPRLAGLGQSEVNVNVNQSRFGSATQSIEVHLVGRYTQLPPQVAAVLSYYWNNQLVDSQVLDNADTAIDRTITVPATQLGFDNNLSIRLDAVPSGSGGAAVPGRGFDCTGDLSRLPIEASFDGRASTLTATAGQPMPPGFERFPQVLSNVLAVAFGDHDQDVPPSAQCLTDAAVLVRELQSRNDQQLTIRVVEPAELIRTGTPGLLVDAAPDEVEQLRAPLRMERFRSIDRTDSNFGVEVDTPFAALQAFEHNSRDLLVLSSWDPEGGAAGAPLQAALVDELAAAEGGWGILFGDLAVKQVPAEPAVLISSGAIVPQPTRVDDFSTYAWWVVAFVALIGLLLGAQQLSRRRLRRRAAQLVEAQEAERGSDSGPTPP